MGDLFDFLKDVIGPPVDSTLLVCFKFLYSSSNVLVFDSSSSLSGRSESNC